MLNLTALRVWIRRNLDVWLGVQSGQRVSLRRSETLFFDPVVLLYPLTRVIVAYVLLVDERTLSRGIEY